MNGRVAFITGASRGVGAAVARSFYELGASVALVSRTRDDLGLGDRALALECDVTSLESVEAAVGETLERFGSLDVAVANAGVGTYGPFLEMAPEAMEQMLDVNLKGTLWTARATLPHLVASGAGDFVSLASVAGVRAFPNEAVYNASKFGQVGFTRALDHEMMAAGVRCTSVAPGGIATDFAMGTGRTPDMPELKGMISAQDAADFVVFAVTRPRNVRMLTTTFRPMGEGSWG